jgi:integrase
MSKPVRRQGSAVYYARRVVPKDLQEHFGRSQIWKSLGTPDLETAKPLERRQQLAWDGEFAAARAKAVVVPEDGQPSSKWLAMSDTQRKAVQDARDRWEQEQFEYQLANSDPDYDDLTPEEQRIQDAVDAARERWEQEQREEREFARQERAAEKAAEAAAKAVGQPTPTPTDGTPLSDVVDRWAKTNQPAEKTVDRMKAVVRWFEDYLGRVPVEQITPDNIESFKDKLLEKTSAPNARVKLRNLNTLLRFAVRPARLIKTNPAAEITVTVKADPARKRTTYEPAALGSVFGSPVYQQGERPDAGASEAAYWLPLLALYTGARLEELGQLRPQDVAEELYLDREGQEQRAWVVRIVEDKADGLELKNAWSQRRVPLHADLIALGFLDYVKAAADWKNGKVQPRIFPALRPDKYGTETANWSKWFNRYLRGTVGIKDRRVVFHSFRHSFKHYSRDVGIAKDAHDALTGHKGRDVADDYGNFYYPLAPLVAAIKHYKVPGFVLPPAPAPQGVLPELEAAE